MKLKKLSSIIIMLAVAVFAFSFATACGGDLEDDVINIELPDYILAIDDEVQTTGTQTITVNISDEAKAKDVTFLSTISKSDVTTANTLLFKTVENVEYVSATQIKVTLSGDSNSVDISTPGILTVAAKAINLNVPAKGEVKVVLSNQFTEISTEDIYNKRVNDSVSELVGKAVTISGNVTAVDTSSATSTRFYLQNGKYGVAVSALNGAVGKELIEVGTDLTVNGVFASSQGSDIELHVGYTSSGYNTSITASNKDHIVTNLTNTDIKSAKDLYIYNGSYIELTDIDVLEVGTTSGGKQKFTVKLGDIEFTFQSSISDTIEVNVGDKINYSGTLLVRYSEAQTLVYIHNADAITVV